MLSMTCLVGPYVMDAPYEIYSTGEGIELFDRGKILAQTLSRSMV